MTSTSRETWLIAIALGALYAVAIACSLHGAERSDEVYHYAQIHLFRHGELRVLDRYLTTIPGYHAAVAALLASSGLDSLGASLFGLVAAAAFHVLRKETHPGTETLATAQFIALPVLAPFFFLVYTDVLALALILWATVATLRGRHALAALVLCGALLVRQSDVVWAGFLAALAAWPLWRASRFAEPKRLIALIAPYLIPVAAFVAFWLWNGSISLSRPQAGLHPLGIHFGNVFVALLIAGMLLPLHSLLGLRDFAEAARRRIWLWAIPPLVFAAFFWGFRADNPYNAAFPSYYLHNGLVQTIVAHAGWRAAAALVAALAACGLASTRLAPAAAVWLYPVSAFFLAAEWLVETRYLIVPFSLWLAFREPRSRPIEYVTLALWAALAVLIIVGTVSGRLFP
jgi:DIE2/ALG10 family protein